MILCFVWFGKFMRWPPGRPRGFPGRGWWRGTRWMSMPEESVLDDEGFERGKGETEGVDRGRLC